MNDHKITRQKPYFPPLDGNVDCSRCENQSCMNRDKPQRGLRNFTYTSGRCPRLPDYRGIVEKSEKELYTAAFPLVHVMRVDGCLYLTLEVPGRKRSRKVYRTKSGYWYCREKGPNGCPAKRVITMEEANTEQIIRARMDMVGTDFCLFRCTVEDYFV